MSNEERFIQWLKIIGITVGLIGGMYAIHLLRIIAYGSCLSTK